LNFRIVYWLALLRIACAPEGTNETITSTLPPCSARICGCWEV